MFASSMKTSRLFFQSVHSASLNKLKLLACLNIHISFIIYILVLFSSDERGLYLRTIYPNPRQYEFVFSSIYWVHPYFIKTLFDR